jgi:PRD1 phage membrane DNA delivery
MKEILESVTSIALAIVGLSLVAVIVSRKAQTPQVIQSAASGFANSLAVAGAPVTGVDLSSALSLGYPSPTSLGYGFGQ